MFIDKEPTQAETTHAAPTKNKRGRNPYIPAQKAAAAVLRSQKAAKNKVSEEIAPIQSQNSRKRARTQFIESEDEE